MESNETLAQQILGFIEKLSTTEINLPAGFRLVNPYGDDQSDTIKRVTSSFYQNYYNDTNVRRIILGSSPARRGTAVTGVPFEDASHLYHATGVHIEGVHVNRASSNFLYDVMNEYGGCTKFYSDFYMNFVCPLGIVRQNAKGNEVNCNYYENKGVLSALYGFIIDALQLQAGFNIDTSVCICIGSGENYRCLSKINESLHLFGKILPLEHPRYIMQYNSIHSDVYMKKYMSALRYTKK